MLREGPTEPMTQASIPFGLPGAVQAAQTIQAQTDVQETMAILADQLLLLYDELPAAGLVRQKRRVMQQHTQTYFYIADGVWEALATDHLAELTSNPSYNVAADTLEQKLVQIHEECLRAPQDLKARGGWLWRRRARLCSQGLLEWKRCIDTSPSGTLPDPNRCGRVLYRAHSRVGLASISGFEHFLLFSLPVLGMLASLALAFLFGTAVLVVPDGLMLYLAPAVVATLLTLYIFWFSTISPSSLAPVIGYALAQRKRTPFAKTLRTTDALDLEHQPGALRGFLRGFLTTMGTLFVVGLASLLALAVFLARDLFASLHDGTGQNVSVSLANLLQTTSGQTLAANDAYALTIGLPVICLVFVALFFLPFTLSVQARLTRELIAYPSRSAEARRYALRPALDLLLFHTITLLLLALLVNIAFNLGAGSVLPPAFPPVSARLLIYLAALILPYVLLVDLPYREGIARWRGTILRELGLRRNEIAQRLSRAQPQALEQADLRTIQDYVTWQYYRTQESEVKHTPSAPFSLSRWLLALILIVLVGIALDQLNGLLFNVLQIRL
jgi:hypothetical protein